MYRVQPLSVEPLLQAGNALRRLKRFQEALETYEKAQALMDATDRDRAELRYQVCRSLINFGLIDWSIYRLINRLID